MPTRSDGGVPNLERFTRHESATVDRVIHDWRLKTPAEMSQASHEIIGWKLACTGETIPYETALFEQQGPASEELEQAAELE